MKNETYIDFKKISLNYFDEQRKKILEEFAEKNEMFIATDKLNFVSECEAIYKKYSQKYITQVKFSCDGIFELKIFRDSIL